MLYICICPYVGEKGRKKCIELYHGCMNKKREVLLFGLLKRAGRGGSGLKRSSSGGPPSLRFQATSESKKKSKNRPDESSVKNN